MIKSGSLKKGRTKRIMVKGRSSFTFGSLLVGADMTRARSLEKMSEIEQKSINRHNISRQSLEPYFKM